MMRVVEPHRVEDGTALYRGLGIRPFLDRARESQTEAFRARLARAKQLEVAERRRASIRQFVLTRTGGLLGKQLGRIELGKGLRLAAAQVIPRALIGRIPVLAVERVNLDLGVAGSHGDD